MANPLDDAVVKPPVTDTPAATPTPTSLEQRVAKSQKSKSKGGKVKKVKGGGGGKTAANWLPPGKGIFGGPAGTNILRVKF